MNTTVLAIRLAIIARIPSIVAATLAWVNRKKINEVHMLVNSRLDMTLEELAVLKKQLEYWKTQPPVEPKDIMPSLWYNRYREERSCHTRSKRTARITTS